MSTAGARVGSVVTVSTGRTELPRPGAATPGARASASPSTVGPQGVAQARHEARASAADLGADGDACDTVETLVSELVTNVVLHARTPYVVRVLDDDACLRVEVVDGSPARPRLHVFGPSEVTGRGLRLIAVLSADSGVAPDDEIATAGKAVWFTLPKLSPNEPSVAQLDALLTLFDVDDRA